MPKAKTLDRLELTRKKFGLASPSEQTRPEHKQGYSVCPNCGRETLIHDGGCEHCESCGYSKCG